MPGWPLTQGRRLMCVLIWIPPNQSPDGHRLLCVLNLLGGRLTYGQGLVCVLNFSLWPGGDELRSYFRVCPESS